MSDPIPTTRALRAAAHDTMLTFLRLELGIANTMLDTALSTRNDAVRQRRRDRARDACSEVRRYLDDDSKKALLSGRERAELIDALDAVGARLVADSHG